MLPPNVELTNGEDPTDLLLTGQPAEVNDNCTATADISIVRLEDVVTNLGECFYLIERSWRFTDACDNAVIGTQQITVLGTLEVSVTLLVQPSCPNSEDGGSLVLDVNSSSPYQISWEPIQPGVGDTLRQLGQGTYTATVTNASGCSQTLSATLNTEDTTPPVITNCPQDTVILLPTGSTATVFSWPSMTATDNCTSNEEILLFSNGYLSATGVFPLGTREVRYWAIDRYANTSDTCRFRVTVQVSDDAVMYVDDENWQLDGSTLRMPIKVLSFNNVLGVQAALNLSPTAFVNGISLLPAAGINPPDWEVRQDTVIGFIWTATDGEPVSLADGSVLFFIAVELGVSSTTCLTFDWTDEYLAPVLVTAEGEEVLPTLLGGSFCGTPELEVFGRIRNLNGVPMREIVVETANLGSSTTDEQGFYGFSEIPWGTTDTLSPYSNMNPLQGVNIVDIVTIRNHILDVDTIEDAYLRIAADVDGSATISVLDMVLIRSLILGNRDEFPSVPSWQFIPEQDELVLPAATNAVPAYRTHSPMHALTQVENQNFKGIKTGDVNLVYNALSHTMSSFMVTVQEEVLDEKHIELHLGTPHPAIGGYQLSLKINPQAGWKFVPAMSVIPPQCDYTYDEARGILLLAAYGATYGAQEEIWPKLVFSTPQSNTKADDWYAFDKAFSMLSTDDAQAGLVKLELRGGVSSSGLSSAGALDEVIVSPNPFGFEIFIEGWPTGASATLHDVNGKMVRQWQAPSKNESGQRILEGLGELPAGVYILYMAQGESLKSFKLIKQSY